MTVEMIKTALGCCTDKACNSCSSCPLEHSDYCMELLSKSALDLINRQLEMIDGLIAGQETLQKSLVNKQAEIERLQKQNNQFADIGKMYSEIKAEAIKEYKNKVENDIVTLLGKSNCTDFVDCLNYRYKEMVGDAE